MKKTCGGRKPAGKGVYLEWPPELELKIGEISWGDTKFARVAEVFQGKLIHKLAAKS